MPTIYNATSIRQRAPKPKVEVAPSPKIVNPDRDPLIIRLHNQGRNRRQIAQYVGMTVTGVREALKRMELIA